ncbi:SusC/RagA family TonB-linked outer membrane protein [Bacteroides sp. An19]|uniref:SusC/RagA family TonB-linked outer membrane protein n=1 Tax=Bacteroides sp. An19 TaxID=1965580 RepID=UPI0031B8176D
MSISSAGTLVVSFIGLQTQEVKIQPVIKVVLKSDEEVLDEVVVVAYGTQKRASITGAVSSVSAGQIEKRPVTNVTSALEGTTTGVQVNSTYGEPGNGSNSIRIRGFGSINGTNEPLIVVDGVPYEGSLNEINTNDIESMSVLKDASSAALYGNKAANGVILITTRNGKGSKPSLNLDIRQGMYTRGIPEYDRLGINDWMETMWKGYQRYYMIDEGMDAASAAAAVNQTLMSNVIKSNIFDKGNTELFTEDGKFLGNVLPGYNDLDWNDALERTGYRQEYNLSGAAAGEKYDLFASGSYLNEKGYVISSDFERFSGRLKANFTPNKWFKSGINLSASSSEGNYANEANGTYYINPFYSARMMAPVYPYYAHDAEGNVVMDENGNPTYNLGQQYLSNRHVVYELENDINRMYTNTMQGQIYATISFLNDFQFTAKGNLFNSNMKQKNYNNPVCGDGAGNNGRLTQYYQRVKDYTLSQELFWAHHFNKHTVDVLLAHEARSYYESLDYTAKANMKMTGDNTELSNFSETTYSEGSTIEYNTESYLARARYNYDDKYYFDASFRRDGSSRFHPDHRWGNFWSVGGSWMISKEKFMEDVTWVDDLKLRASYGEVGNDAGVDYYAYMALYNSDTNAGLGAYYKNQLMNEDLKWETTTSFDIAVEARLFDRWNISFDYFDKRSRDLLFNVYNPLSAGATDLWGIGSADATAMSSMAKNIGSVSNRGIEIATDVDVIRTKDWNWNIGMNLTWLKNEIIELPDGEDILNGVQMFSEGHSIYEFYMYQYAGVDQMNGRALYEIDPTKVESAKAAGYHVNINGTDYTYNTTYARKDWSGTALPTVYGSISTSVSYKDLTLSILGTYSLGGKTYDTTYASLMSSSVASPNALHTDVLNAWQSVPAGMTEDSPNRVDPNGIPRFDLSSQDAYSQGSCDRWLQNSSYFILKNINLNYNLPKRWVTKLGLGGISVYGSIENAFTITSLKGMNPQYSFNGTMDNTFVTARVYTLGVNLKF